MHLREWNANILQIHIMHYSKINLCRVLYSSVFISLICTYNHHSEIHRIFAKPERQQTYAILWLQEVQRDVGSC